MQALSLGRTEIYLTHDGSFFQRERSRSLEDVHSKAKGPGNIIIIFFYYGWLNGHAVSADMLA